MTEKGSVANPKDGEATSADDNSAKTITKKAVLEYLQHHPDLLTENPELLEILTTGTRYKSDDNVVDMQKLMLHRLREENNKLRDAYASLIANARDNRTSQNQVHECVLQILAARSFEKLIHTVTADLPMVLEADAVTICLEAGDVTIPKSYASGLRSLAEGEVDSYLGLGRNITLSSDVFDNGRLFGAASGLVRSRALARLNVSTQAPKGLLAIGSRDVDAFRHGQGTELIDFLARSLEVTIRQWLNLPT